MSYQGTPEVAATRPGSSLRSVPTGPLTVLPLDTAVTPTEALRRLGPLRPALLESRTGHPGARASYVPFHPVAQAVLWPDRLEVRRGDAGAADTITRQPLAALMGLLDTVRGTVPDRSGFAGGWVGWIAHEAHALLLGTPVPPPSPPARPALPLAVFRRYADALRIDAATGAAELLGLDTPDAPGSATGRLADAARRLAAAAPATAPARVLDAPVRTLDDAGFTDRLLRLQALVREGDCFQANLTSSTAYPWAAAPSWHGLVDLYQTYAAANPGPWNAFWTDDHVALLSASPELLVAVEGDRLRLRPIAGTRGRGRDEAEDERLAQALRADPKERAEHAMLVDLARNDAASIARPGTVAVTSLAGVERYRHVMHLVSEVEGRIDPGRTVLDVLRAVFPGGTVTGAPKRRAVRRITELEGAPRGPYTGTFGYVSATGDMEFNLLIRTLVATGTHLVAHAGCGIVEGSRPRPETLELAAKMRAQVEAALGRADPAPAHLRCGHAERGPAWSYGAPATRRDGRVLLIDFEDSFVHNLADAFGRLGATPRVHSIHDAVATAWDPPPTHLVLSPGPGRPDDFPAWTQHLARAEALGLPVLGVCLGHQALAQHAGARIARHPETVHGKATPVERAPHAATDPLLAPWRGRHVGRYHSLIAREAPATLLPLAHLEDGTLMAARHADRPWWGLQFHPESLLTEDGLTLLAAFLEVTPRA